MEACLGEEMSASLREYSSGTWAVMSPVVALVGDLPDGVAEVLAEAGHTTLPVNDLVTAREFSVKRRLGIALHPWSRELDDETPAWRSHLGSRDVPLIIVDDPIHEASALASGAADFVAWPASGVQLSARIEHNRRLGEELAELRSLAANDPLTGTLNRRAFDERLEYEFAQVQRYGGELSLAVIDLDHFKSINDQHGHDVGDVVLKQLAGALADLLRETDTLSRYGGEEFVALLPETSLQGAQRALERLLETIVAQRWSESQLQVSFSAGVASIGDSRPRSPVDMFRLADQALYKAKSAGRARVHIAEAPPTCSETP